jgi:FHA domain-containing protein
MRLQGWVETLRTWIDGEEELDEQGEPKPRSKWDDFLVAIARDIEQCMQREMFTPPGGPTYIPREYIVFLHPDDDAEWQGEKREGLLSGLHHVLTERAKEMAGDTQFQTRTLTVELRVDPALEKGRFRVQHVWDTEAQKTMVKPRKRAELPQKQMSSSGTAELVAAGIDSAEDEATIVRPRKPAEPVFVLAVRRIGLESGSAEAPPSVPHPFYKDEITIGRGARQVDVDLKLEGDLEISRQHATLARTNGEFKITCKGANPISLEGGREITAGESATVRSGEKILLCSYELVIQ